MVSLQKTFPFSVENIYCFVYTSANPSQTSLRRRRFLATEPSFLGRLEDNLDSSSLVVNPAPDATSDPMSDELSLGLRMAGIGGELPLAVSRSGMNGGDVEPSRSVVDRSFSFILSRHFRSAISLRCDWASFWIWAWRLDISS